MTFAAVSSLALALALSAAVPLQAQTAAPSAATVPTLEQIFRAEPYRSEPAKDAAFSRSGRYLAYLWSPFGEPGTDLWVHDTKTGKTQRVTSPQVMAAFEAPEDMARFDRKLKQRNDEYAERQAREVAQQAYLHGDKVDLSQWESARIEVLKKELAEKKAKDDAQKAADKADAEVEKQAMAALAARRAGKPVPAAAPASAASSPDKKDDKEKELWELRDELKKKLARDKLKPADLYPGPAQFVWAHRADELVFQYRGGLYRWAVGDKAPAPLVATQRELRTVAYTADDAGFVFMDETRVLRLSFRRPGVEVVNRELIHPDDEQKKYRIAETAISEDGRWMSLVATAPLKGADDKPAPAGRQVEIMNYSDRWATAKKVGREVSDDKRTEKPLALYIRQVPANGAAPRKQPEPVFTNAGGDVWFEMSDVAWARDGSRYAFTTWERDKELLRVYIGQADENAKPEMVLERRGDVGHEVVNVLKPRFTPDGKTLVLTLDETGWRQPYAIDVATKALRPLLKGEFEAPQVVGITADSKALFVLANQGDFAAMNVLRVDLASGAMQALGAAGEYHRGAVASEDGRWVAANAGNWAQRPELKLLAGDAKANPKAEARTLTDSTDKAWADLHLLQPERFAFTNRHGDRIEAYVFKPAGWQATDKRPGIVYVYGGPLNDRHIVEVDSFQPTAYLFGQYMAAKHGFVTIAVDPRGHSNYGRKFSDANWEHPGEPQAEDLEDLVKLLPGYGVDPARVGLNGWSFGGFQTQYTMYTRPDLFAAGIAGAGPTEWENYNSWYSGRTIGKATDRTKPVLRRFSLLPLAKGLKHPLMLVHGMQDPNVLYQDTVNVYRELLDSGKESLVELFLDPDGVHALGGVVKPAGWHRKYEAFWIRTLAPRLASPR
ncbi:S9 family peptidase [Roseateles sp. BYS78W]|uniref:S9 family peptidase n=1 Tax=Pelomonas candidula TaxID=3299025 RepID=A0ABW7HE27_9BURK